MKKIIAKIAIAATAFLFFTVSGLNAQNSFNLNAINADEIKAAIAADRSEAPDSQKQIAPSSADIQKEWTIMVFMNSKNNLSQSAAFGLSGKWAAKDLAEMKIKHAKKISESANVMKKFVATQLHKEIKELHEDQVMTANKFEKLEEFVVEALAREITEFHKDKKDLNETKVRLIKEGKTKLTETKNKFIQNAAIMVENIVNENLKSELTMLKEDIESARKVDFGRKLFEAFASEYQNSYLNEKSETKKLLQAINSKDDVLQEAAKAINKAEKIIESKDKELKTLKESIERNKIMSELLAPLNKEQKSIMNELMTTVKTSKLTESFDKYLPSVINGTSKPNTKKTLVESTVITGNKKQQKINSEDDTNIIDIRRLAGL